MALQPLRAQINIFWPQNIYAARRVNANDMYTILCRFHCPEKLMPLSAKLESCNLCCDSGVESHVPLVIPIVQVWADTEILHKISDGDEARRSRCNTCSERTLQIRATTTEDTGPCRKVQGVLKHTL